MREIKFRAWDKAKNKMFPVAEISWRQGGLLFNYQVSGFMNMSAWEEKDAIIMQYTGLKDKNGKEIYEGDIVDNRGGNIDIIKWGEFECGFIPAITTETEVIGNIYENPELIPN